MIGRTQRENEIVGREEERSVVREFLARGDGSGLLVIAGAPGAGKTTLWEDGLAAVREQGVRVLSARPSDAEAQLGFAALTDLLDGIALDELETLLDPQRRALEVALLRVAPSEQDPDPRAIGLAVLNALRGLADESPVVVAIDDVQWLDRPSSDALVFAARRLAGEAVRFLVTVRPDGARALGQAFPSGAERLDVGPLSLGATRRLLSRRLGLSITRQLLRQIHDASLGSPMFVLELGRALRERGPLEPGDDLPVPEAIDELVGTRVAALDSRARMTLLALALSGDLHPEHVTEVVGEGALDIALAARVVVSEDDRLRAAHPLLAAAAKHQSTAGEQRALHLALAHAVGDEELRVRHLALATERPDAELAATAQGAAALAAARGATQDAVEVARHALRLTPAGAPERSTRVLRLAGYLHVAGEADALSELLGSELDSLPPGEPRVRAALLLCHGGSVTSNAEIKAYLGQALAESGSNQVLRATVLAPLSSNVASIDVERIEETEAWAMEALESAPAAGVDVERNALYAVGWSRALRGRPIDDVCERFRSASEAAFYIAQSPERAAVQRLFWRGELARSRTQLERLLRLADERGEPESYALLRLHLCELELRSGNWEAASRGLDEWAESSDRMLWPMYERCRALLAAGRGDADDARRWAAEAIAAAKRTGNRWDLLQARRALGTAALFLQEPARAAEELRVVWQHNEREGIDDPGAFPVAPDLVEALVDLGEPDEALTVIVRLRRLADEQGHPWGRSSVVRCVALVGLAEGYDDVLAASFREAAEQYGVLGLRLERACSLLRLGRTQRRYRKWGAARESLEGAVAAFEEMGSEGWARAARSELDRVGARRRPPAGELTAAERRTAELAADGLSNKEIAQRLVVSSHTVEAHLSSAYAKLGVRSRAQLGTRLTKRDKD